VLLGFDNQKVCEAMGCAEDALFVYWFRPDPDRTSDPAQ
jgi:hypothetical protein